MQSGLCKQTGATAKQRKIWKRESGRERQWVNESASFQSESPAIVGKSEVRTAQHANTAANGWVCVFVCVYGAKLENRIWKPNLT